MKWQKYRERLNIKNKKLDLKLANGDVLRGMYINCHGDLLGDLYWTLEDGSYSVVEYWRLSEEP